MRKKSRRSSRDSSRWRSASIVKMVKTVGDTLAAETNPCLLKEGNTWSHYLRIVFSSSSLIDLQLWSIGNFCSCHILLSFFLGGGREGHWLGFLGGKGGVEGEGGVFFQAHVHNKSPCGTWSLHYLNASYYFSQFCPIYCPGLGVRWTLLAILWTCTPICTGSGKISTLCMFG